MTELTAGRAMDRLVAEKVMGWPIIPDSPDSASEDWFDNYLEAGGALPAVIVHNDWVEVAYGEFHKDWRAFSPSTDIAAAWRVVEKLLATPLADGDHPIAVGVRTWFSHEEHGLRASCSIFRSVANDRIVAFGDTAAEAIARAALKAVRHE